MAEPTPPRRFRLRGPTGVVEAHGVVWDNNSASIKWIGDRDHVSFVVWPDMTKALAANFNGSGDSGRNITVEWIDE